MEEYQKTSREARLKTLELIYKAQTSHVGSCFSCVDILTVLFDKVDPTKDEVVLSAGWKAASWYYFLWKRGVITKEELNSFCMPESPFIGLVEPIEGRWGLKIGGGSMGLGLPGAVGLALAKKLKGEEGKVYVLMSDGELQIGTTWESALIAAQHKLDNLVVIVDNNGLQAMGKNKDILGDVGFPIGKSWAEKDWHSRGVDGHNHEKIAELLDMQNEFAIDIKYGGAKPFLLNFNTVKGKGVSFMENNNLYHYKQLSQGEYENAKKELNV